MKNSNLQICNQTIHPGESLSLALPLPELFSCAPLFMPIKVIHGKQSGPCLLVTAAMHGNQLNGTEIINKLLALNRVQKLHGTLIAVPVLNVYGLINRSRYLPGDISLDTSFPGSETGTHDARLAHIFSTEIFSKADACIDLQTGDLNYSNLPQIYVHMKDKAAKSMAVAFNAPVISNAECEKGMYKTMAHEAHKPFVLYEAGEAMRFDPYAIKTGVDGVINVMKKLEMLPDRSPKNPKQKQHFFSDSNVWVHAEASGVCHSQLELGQRVKEGDLLCTISDPFGAADSVDMYSPHEGVVIGKNNLPLVQEGEALFQLAVFRKMEQAASRLEEWQENSGQEAEESD